MSARIDQTSLEIEKTFWLRGGRYTNRVTVKMVRNDVVFFTRYTNGKTEWDRLTITEFIKQATIGEESEQAQAQQHDYAAFENSADADYIANLRHNRE